jgi:hypothetical protein
MAAGVKSQECWCPNIPPIEGGWTFWTFGPISQISKKLLFGHFGHPYASTKNGCVNYEVHGVIRIILIYSLHHPSNPVL